MVRDFVQMIAVYSACGMSVFNGAEAFWQDFNAPEEPYDLLRFSMLMGILPFSGYLLLYTITGKIWNMWPFIQSTLSVTQGLMCEGLQWIFFATFPILSALLLETILGRHRSFPESSSCTVVTTYTVTPLFMAALFVGGSFFGRILAVLAIATFLYLLYFGYRI